MEVQADIPDITGTINTLNLQIQDCRTKLISAREEAATLRQENLNLTDRNERMDRRFKDIEKELDDLNGKEVYRWHGKGKERRPTRRSRGGFAVLLEGHAEYKDIWQGKSTTKDHNSELRELLSRTTPGIPPEMLTEHSWKVSPIDERDLKAGRTDSDLQSGVEDTRDGQDIYGTSNTPKEASPAQQRTNDEERHEQPEKGIEQDLYDIDGLPRRHSEYPVRRDYFHPSDPRRDSLQDSIFGRHARSKRKRPRNLGHNLEGYPRKAVCLHCWLTGTLCDFEGQCAPCRKTKVKCIRKLCELGLSCRNPRCPCLHPGQ